MNHPVTASQAATEIKPAVPVRCAFFLFHGLHPNQYLIRFSPYSGNFFSKSGCLGPLPSFELGMVNTQIFNLDFMAAEG